MLIMSSINIFNIINKFKKLVSDNYLYQESKINKLEVNLARVYTKLLRIYNSINNDYETKNLLICNQMDSDLEMEEINENQDTEHNLDEKEVRRDPGKYVRTHRGEGVRQKHTNSYSPICLTLCHV